MFRDQIMVDIKCFLLYVRDHMLQVPIVPKVILKFDKLPTSSAMKFGTEKMSFYISYPRSKDTTSHMNPSGFDFFPLVWLIYSFLTGRCVIVRSYRRLALPQLWVLFTRRSECLLECWTYSWGGTALKSYTERYCTSWFVLYPYVGAWTRMSQLC